MSKHIKTILQNSKINIDNQEVLGILPRKKMIVDSVVSYDIDDGIITIVSLDNFAVVYCNVMDIKKYYFCEVYDEGCQKLKYYKNGTFARSFKLADEKYICPEGYSFTVDNDDNRLVIYESENAYYSFILINWTPISWFMYRGFEIEENQIKF